MNSVALVFGIFAILGMFFGLIPCLGWYNWFNIIFAGLGILLGIIAVAIPPHEGKCSAIAGLVMCIIAVGFGVIRLVLGGGVI